MRLTWQHTCWPDFEYLLLNYCRRNRSLRRRSLRAYPILDSDWIIAFEASHWPDHREVSWQITRASRYPREGSGPLPRFVALGTVAWGALFSLPYYRAPSLQHRPHSDWSPRTYLAAYSGFGLPVNSSSHTLLEVPEPRLRCCWGTRGQTFCRCHLG